MRSDRRFSQAISEGDGISLIADVGDLATARSAAGQGAEAITVRGEVGDLREATELPVLWRAAGSPSVAALAGADAWLVTVANAGEDTEWLVRQHAEAIELGLDCVVEVRTEEQLELALELLPDVPAGKLAVADVPVSSREQVEELERAGVDAVIVGARHVADLAGDVPPPV